MGNTDNNRIDQLLVNLIKSNNLTDIASHVNNRTHTYIGYKATSLIDRIIISDSLKHHFIQYNNIICPHSDHNMITCNMFNPKDTHCNNQKRFRMWKLNNSLLDRPTIEKLAKFWEEWRSFMHNFSSTLDWYIKGKQKIKQILITIGKQRAKERHDEENILNTTIKKEMEKQDRNLVLIKECKSKLEKLIQYKIEGMKVRTRTETLPNEEKGSRAFFNIENKHKKQMNINTLMAQNGDTLFSEKDIKTEIHRFYQDLYTNKSVSQTAIERLVDEYKPIKNFNEKELEELNAPFTLKEVEKILNKMNNNKSPGPDGLTKEYYIAMWEHIKYDILSFTQGIDLHNTLPTDLTTGIIKLLYKNKNPRIANSQVWGQICSGTTIATGR